MTQKQRDEFLAFLQLEQIEVQHIDGNLRLYFAEIAWAEAREALAAEDRSETLKWTEYCIRVAANNPWCEGIELNTRAWIIQNFGHQDGHKLLDSRVLVDRFFVDLAWTPAKAVQAAHDGWERKDNELLMVQRKIREMLMRLDGIKDKLNYDDQLRLKEWFAVHRTLR